MLLATISNDNQIKELNLSQIKKQDSYYAITVDNKSLGKVSVNPTDIRIEFKPDLAMEEFKVVHDLILSINEIVQGKISDDESMLGYLKEGEPACIVTNWDKWYSFLNEAKLKSLVGQKVRVFDHNNKELSNGMLVEYKTTSTDNLPFAITDCNIITIFGEKTFSGDFLKIEPVNEW